MNSDKLIHMANQIGTFFDSMPDRTEAVLGVAEHLKSFWDPRMRRAFLLAMDQGPAGEVPSAIVRAAVDAHRALLAPASMA